MNSPRTITLRQYYRCFVSLSGSLAALLSALPILSGFLPSGYSAYGFPPLGDPEGLARLGTFALALAVTYLTFFTQRAHITRAIACAFIFFCLYLGLSFRFVRTIQIPTKNTSVQVSVGYRRTSFANANFGTATDWEMLRDRGTTEEQIWKLWTTDSIIVSRLALFLSYLLCITFLIAAFSWGVLSECLGHGKPG